MLLGAGAMSALLAQQPAPPPWTQGRPAEQATSPLAPHPQPPVPKPARDIPIDKVTLPPGFKIEIWADMVANARSMVLGSKGTLFVGSRGAGTVYAVVDKGGQREVTILAKGLRQPNGVAFKDGALYVAEISRITRYDGIEDRLDSPPEPQLVGQKHIPCLAGQHYQYLVQQLGAYKAQTRADLDGSMTMAAQPLSLEDIETLARYIAQVQPGQ